MYNVATLFKYTAKYNSHEIPIGFDYGNMKGFLLVRHIHNKVKYKFIIERYLKGN